MKEIVSKIFMWIFTGIILVFCIVAFRQKAYIAAIMLFFITVICSPLVQDKILKGQNGYFQEMKMILTFLGVIFCLMVMQIYVNQMSAQGMGEADIFDKMEGYLKILVYLLYLGVIFLYKDESQFRNYIIFGIIYMVCVVVSYIPSGDKSMVVSILNKLTHSQDLDVESYNILIDDILMPIKESWINTRLDNLDGLIQQIIDDSNTHSGEIKDTITNTANEFGINLSDGMKSIWETNTNNINNNITSVFNDFGTKFDNTMTTLNNVVSGIESKVQEMLSLANEEAAQRQAELEEQRRQQEAAESNSSSSDDYSEPDYDWDDIGGGDSDSSSGGDGVDWIYSPDYFPKDQLNVNTSIVDRLKSLDYDSSFGARAMYFEQMGLGNDYTGSYDDNVAMLEWMKSRGIGGYRKGTKSATKGLHIYGEDNPGSEVLVTKYGVLRQFDSGDTVFNKDQVEKLWNLSKGITTPNMYMDNLGAKLPDITPVSTNKSVDIGGINVNVDKVVTDNPEDFTRQLGNALAGNSKIQKILGEINSNQLLGRNSLSTRRYMK